GVVGRGRRAGSQAAGRRPGGPPLLGAGARLARRGRRSGLSRQGGGSARGGPALDTRGAPRAGPRYIIGIGQADMLTGIVSAMGRVAKATREAGNGKRETGLTLTVRAPFTGVKRGESIAVNGACLTVERVVKGGFTVHVVQTTAGRTLFAEYAAGRRVNLERALRATDRLGGHFVQGHVDGVGTVERVATQGDALLLDIRVPPEVDEATIPHGSIAVDGVSLTVNARPGQGVIQVSLIPFTREHTTLGALQVGERVHVEGDVLGKYVRQLWHSDR